MGQGIYLVYDNRMALNNLKLFAQCLIAFNIVFCIR